MPLHVKLVREGVSWPRQAAVAFRVGVADLEDHLLSMGVADGDLSVHVVRGTAGEAQVQAVVSIGAERIPRTTEDTDLGLALGSVFQQLLEDASAERLAAAVSAMPELETGAWEEVRTRLVAYASHALHRAVGTDDLPAGSIEADDLVDDALVAALEGAAIGDPSQIPYRQLRQRVNLLLARRIDEQHARVDDVDLNATVDAAPGRADDDELFTTDRGPERNEDIVVDPKLAD